jgi:hypothetical protein
LSGDLSGPPSSPTVEYWMSFADYPTARAWYRAHNASVVAAYLEHCHLAVAENAAERFFMNVVLCRVLYAHALVAAPRISLGWLRALAPALGNPRLGMTGIFLQLSRVLPDEYPLRDDVASYLSDELGFGRLLDFGSNSQGLPRRADAISKAGVRRRDMGRVVRRALSCLTARSGRLHRRDDARAKRRKADVRRRAAFAGRRAAGSPRRGQWRLVTACAGSGPWPRRRAFGGSRERVLRALVVLRFGLPAWRDPNRRPQSVRRIFLRAGERMSQV